MNTDEDRANTITKYSISEQNVIGTYKEKESSYDLLTIIMLGLGNAKNAEDKPILKLLDILLSSDTKPNKKKEILERDFNIPMSASISEEANIMCNLGEGIREQAYEQAYEQATKSTWVEAVLNMMKSLKLSAEEAMNAIGIPDKDRQPILDMVSKKLAAK